MIGVGICGTHCTGKTTLARLLAHDLNQKYGETVIIEEQVRAVCGDLGFERIGDVKKAGRKWFSIVQWEVLRRQINMEQRAVEEGLNFVSDRTTIDNAAYYAVGQDEDTSAMRTNYTNIARWNARNNYDLIVYVPIMFPAAEDGFRDIDEEFRQQVDHLIIQSIPAGGVFTRLTTDTPEARVAEVLEQIEKRVVR